MRLRCVFLVLASVAPVLVAEDGAGDADFAFTRLEFDCVGWDDGMDAGSGNADRNLIARVAELPEAVRLPLTESASLTVGELADLPAEDQPPFLFVTGEAPGDLSRIQLAVLRAYLDGGGTLIVDVGSRAFGEWFLEQSRRLTGLPPVVVADDDPLYRAPFRISPEGIALFHHVGRRVTGVRKGGRWVLLIHPGDVNDALKDQGGRIPRRLRTVAFRFLVNAMHLAVAHRRGTEVPGAEAGDPGGAEGEGEAAAAPGRDAEDLFLTPEEEAERAEEAEARSPRVEVEVEPPSILDRAEDAERDAEREPRTAGP